MTTHEDRPAKLYLEKACYGVYVGLFSGLIFGALLLGFQQYLRERQGLPYDIDDSFVFLASAGGAGLGAVIGAPVGFVAGFLEACKMKLRGAEITASSRAASNGSIQRS